MRNDHISGKEKDATNESFFLSILCHGLTASVFQNLPVTFSLREFSIIIIVIYLSLATRLQRSKGSTLTLCPFIYMLTFCVP